LNKSDYASALLKQDWQVGDVARYAARLIKRQPLRLTHLAREQRHLLIGSTRQKEQKQG
jgi:hypothetical protein